MRGILMIAGFPFLVLFACGRLLPNEDEYEEPEYGDRDDEYEEYKNSYSSDDRENKQSPMMYPLTIYSSTFGDGFGVGFESETHSAEIRLGAVRLIEDDETFSYKHTIDISLVHFNYYYKKPRSKLAKQDRLSFFGLGVFFAGAEAKTVDPSGWSAPVIDSDRITGASAFWAYYWVPSDYLRLGGRLGLQGSSLFEFDSIGGTFTIHPPVLALELSIALTL